MLIQKITIVFSEAIRIPLFFFMIVPFVLLGFTFPLEAENAIEEFSFQLCFDDDTSVQISILVSENWTSYLDNSSTIPLTAIRFDRDITNNAPKGTIIFTAAILLKVQKVGQRQPI